MIWPLHTRVAFVAYRVSYVKSELRFPEFPLLQTPGVQGTWRGFAGGLGGGSETAVFYTLCAGSQAVAGQSSLPFFS